MGGPGIWAARGYGRPELARVIVARAMVGIGSPGWAGLDWAGLDWLLRNPPAQRPELGPPLDLERRGPRQPGRPQLDPQARGGLPGQLGITGGPAGQFGGSRLDLLRRQGLPGQAQLHRAQAGDLLAEDARRRRGLGARAPRQQREVPAA